MGSLHTLKTGRAAPKILADEEVEIGSMLEQDIL